MKIVDEPRWRQVSTAGSTPGRAASVLFFSRPRYGRTFYSNYMLLTPREAVTQYAPSFAPQNDAENSKQLLITIVFVVYVGPVDPEISLLKDLF